MNINYLNALDKIILLKGALQKLLEAATCKTLEDREGCSAIEKLIEQLQDAQWVLEHYSRHVEEGWLIEKGNGRFIVNNKELTCGYPLEVWNEQEKEWEIGRVEHSSNKGGYYFYNPYMKYPSLYEGMKVRIRINK